MSAGGRPPGTAIAGAAAPPVPIAPCDVRGPLSPAIQRQRTQAISGVYERGWQEGWTACLAAIQRDGLATVLGRDAALCAPAQLALGMLSPTEYEDLHNATQAA